MIRYILSSTYILYYIYGTISSAIKSLCIEYNRLVRVIANVLGDSLQRHCAVHILFSTYFIYLSATLKVKSVVT